MRAGEAIRTAFVLASCASALPLEGCSARGDVYMARSGRPASGNVGGTSTQPTSGAGAANPATNILTTPGQAGSTSPIMLDAGMSMPTRTPPAPSGPVSIDRTGPNNSAGLPVAEVTQLQAGGPLGDLKWLYPYDGTVMPQGMIAPPIMWNGDAATDAVYLEMKSNAFEYKDALKPTPNKSVIQQLTVLPASGTKLLIPQEIWDIAGQKTQGRNDPITLKLTVRLNGKISGPLVSHVTIAPGNFKGSIYYNSCYSSMNGANASLSQVLGGNGKLMRIPPGGVAQLLLSQSGQPDQRCQGCHSVAANGSRIIAQRGPTGEETFAQGTGAGPDVHTGLSYALPPDGPPAPLLGNMVGPNASYGALYPDGSKFLSTAIPPTAYLMDDPNYGLSQLGRVASYGINLMLIATNMLVPATLYDAQSGEVATNTGIPTGALMPMFSPDGTRLVFNDYALSNAHNLVTMTYDTKQHRATDAKVLLQDTDLKAPRPGWPFFLPDNKAVVFVRSTSPTFSAMAAGATSTVAAAITGEADAPMGEPSDLHIADVATGKATLLANAMGFRTQADADADMTYLPFGKLDLHRNYFPTVSQVPAGGYYWVFFDSLRHYGSLGTQRALWGFALDVRADGNYTTDPSHPPFYLQGQEFATSNNHRAFAALDPCKKDGAACTSPVDCCEGFTCAIEENVTETMLGLPVGRCAPPPPTQQCAKRDERCSMKADCCDPNDYCINNVCAFVDLL